MTLLHLLKTTAAGLLLAAATVQAQPATTPQVADAWARPTVQGQRAGGAFLRIDSPTADRLVAGSTPVAGRVELHRMQMDGDVMRMRQLDGIDVPAGQGVALQPGALHLMLMELKTPLKPGDSFPLTLRFEKAGEVKVDVKVQAAPPAAGAHRH